MDPCLWQWRKSNISRFGLFESTDLWLIICSDKINFNFFDQMVSYHFWWSHVTSDQSKASVGDFLGSYFLLVTNRISRVGFQARLRSEERENLKKFWNFNRLNSCVDFCLKIGLSHRMTPKDQAWNFRSIKFSPEVWAEMDRKFKNSCCQLLEFLSPNPILM